MLIKIKKKKIIKMITSDHSLCSKSDVMCCCKYITRRDYSILLFGRDIDEMVKPRQKIIAKEDPRMESRRRFKEKYGDIVNELENIYKRRYPSTTSNQSDFIINDVDKKIKVEELSKPVRPKYNLMGHRRKYMLTPKKAKKEENEDASINERFKLIENDFYTEQLTIVNENEINLCNSDNNEIGAAFYDVIEYDRSEEFHTNVQLKSNCHIIRVREERAYYLDEVPYLYVQNLNRKTEKVQKFRKINKRVHFNDEPQILNNRNGIISKIFNKLKKSIKKII